LCRAAARTAIPATRTWTSSGSTTTTTSRSRPPGPASTARRPPRRA
jgi:hypothetical protein